MELIDGKEINKQMQAEIAAEVEAMVARGEKRPNLAVIQVGNDGASTTYVNSKVKTCHAVGFESTDVRFPEDIKEELEQLGENKEEWPMSKRQAQPLINKLENIKKGKSLSVSVKETFPEKNSYQCSAIKLV